MTLHEDKELFKELVEATAKEMDLPPLYIEKDYWVTYLLHNLSKSDYKEIAIFKGGTSLSKAYKIIERFSEDIDLAVVTKKHTGSNQIKKLLKNIEKAILDDNFTELPNHPQVSKGSEFRKSVHTYTQLQNGDFGHANEGVIIELNSFAKPHPFVKKSVCSYITDFLSLKAASMVDEYNLQPFDINVLDYRRTFCEKISAIARASIESDSEYSELKAKIRHFYDIYFLLSEKEISNFLHSEDFIAMMHNVREDDKRQFQKNEWTNIPISGAQIFTDTQTISDALEHFYNQNFKDLVYKTLPPMDRIAVCIKEISNVLKNSDL